MRKIKITFNKNKFFSEEDPPEEDGMPDQPNEPTDYLHGNPATVLDLKEPLAKYDEDKAQSYIRDLYGQWWNSVTGDNLPQADPNDPHSIVTQRAIDNRVNEYTEGYKDALNNFNKESAINRHLNELGSTNYDLAGESFREFNPLIASPLKSTANAFEAPGLVHYILPEKLNIGIEKLKHVNTPDAIAHELGHANDPNLAPFFSFESYGDDHTKDEIESRWGKVIADLRDSMKPENEGSGKFEHDQRPEELYADAAAMRSALFKSGAWNGKDPVTEDMVNDYLSSERDYLIGTLGHDIPYSKELYSPSKRLIHFFKPGQIADLLNSSRRYSIK